MKNGLKKALHYIKLIFKKTTLDNVIVAYFIDELVHNTELITKIKYLAERGSGRNISHDDIESVLGAIRDAYNRHF